MRPGVGDTIGVEEEFHVLDPATGALVPAAHRLLRDDAADAQPEMQRSMIETASEVHTDLSDLRRDLSRKRRGLFEAAGRIGLTVAASGTVPTSGAQTSQVAGDPRYEWMAQEYRQLVDEQQVCACQVQVGVPDRDLAVRITRRIRAWLPVLLAMTGSSPFFQASDTGYASYRTVVVSRWPTVGPPPDFASAQEYDATVDMLLDSGVISDAGMIYFDARLSARYPTIEIRVADSCPRLDDAILLAALARALVVTAAVEDAAGLPLPESPQVLLRAATWRAARSGLDGRLVDPLTVRAVPATELVGALLRYLRPALEDRGDWDTAAELTRALLIRGPSARSQRAAVRRGEEWPAMTAALAALTAEG
jgi:carboxylate-amine ligase